MPQWLLTLIANRFIDAIIKWVALWIKGQQAKKRAKKQVNEIKKIKDPSDRAHAMDSLFLK